MTSILKQKPTKDLIVTTNNIFIVILETKLFQDTNTYTQKEKT
jgi:hypothetical protein